MIFDYKLNSFLSVRSAKNKDFCFIKVINVFFKDMELTSSIDDYYILITLFEDPLITISVLMIFVCDGRSWSFQYGQ